MKLSFKLTRSQNRFWQIFDDMEVAILKVNESEHRGRYTNVIIIGIGQARQDDTVGD